MTSEILRFSEKKTLADESIQEYEFHEYESQDRTNLNHAGEITINIELQNLFTHYSFGLSSIALDWIHTSATVNST